MDAEGVEMKMILTLLALGAVGSTLGCSSSDSNGTPDYSATIVRTKYGVPHIAADSYGDLGFGAAYAYAQDNVCLFM